MEAINFKQFQEIAEKLEITLGRIVKVERVPKSDKMLKLTVEFFEGALGTVMTNIGNKINPDDLLQGVYPFVTNLEAVKIMGETSVAMIMIPTREGEIDLDGNPGSKLL
jgi:methionyl-tRNA synthetase